jgi:hypothetical protein
MHTTREITLSAVWSAEQKQWSLWYSATDQDGHWVVKGVLFTPSGSLSDRFLGLCKDVERFGDIIPSRRKFRKPE